MVNGKHRILFVVNPVSGNGRARRIEELLSDGILDRDSFEYKVAYTSYPGHAAELAVAGDCDIVAAVGGDGTVNEIAGVLSGQGPHDKQLAIIPCGSGNGLALHLGISLDPSKAIAGLNRASRKSMDAGTLCGKQFFCTCGMGLDADVAFDFANSGKRGLPSYIRSFFKVNRTFKPSGYTFRTEEGEFTREAFLITAGNANQWGNHALITPEADIADGLLDITVIKEVSALNLPILAARLMDGRLYRCGSVEHFRCSSLSIERQDEGAVHYDGEPAMMGRILDIDTKHNELDIFV